MSFSINTKNTNKNIFKYKKKIQMKVLKFFRTRAKGMIFYEKVFRKFLKTIILHSKYVNLENKISNTNQSQAFETAL